MVYLGGKSCSLPRCDGAFVDAVLIVVIAYTAAVTLLQFFTPQYRGYDGSLP
jgi:hypothetical protein